MAVDSYYTEKFWYGLIMPTPRSGGTTFYYVRNDRALFDWIVEPVEEKEFIQGEAHVALPEGYFIARGMLNKPSKNVPFESKTVARVIQREPTLFKAFYAIAGAKLLEEDKFKAKQIPVYRIFYVDLP